MVFYKKIMVFNPHKMQISFRQKVKLYVDFILQVENVSINSAEIENKKGNTIDTLKHTLLNTLPTIGLHHNVFKVM
jgi:nicotinic acid mononucleotide adenylyltransferase